MQKTRKNKKILDILSEIDGKPVYPTGKKEKVLDLTDEIKLFLEKDISYDSIKDIILRMERGPISDYESLKAKMKITKVCKQGYFILIVCKAFEEKFYLDGYTLIRINYFREKDIITSSLKSQLRNRIHDWLEKQNLPFEYD